MGEEARGEPWPRFMAEGQPAFRDAPVRRIKDVRPLSVGGSVAALGVWSTLPNRHRKAGLCPEAYAGGNGLAAGPLTTSPVGPKREPWQGQSNVASPGFQATVQPMWVQRAESR